MNRGIAKSRALRAALLAIGLSGQPAAAAEPDEALDDLDVIELDLEALARLTITSVSRKEEPLESASAAVYVITSEDIRASGARTLPELLRDVPGLSVARVNSFTWAISARGFSSPLADKLEILLDGRTLYTPLFSGVFWDQQGTALEDIERIEIVRGPGGALWGANAVNGVINILTKPAARTQGARLSVTHGGEMPYVAALRYGTELGNAALRGYLKGQKLDSTLRVDNGMEGQDDWDRLRGGFRADWEGWTVQGDAYDGAVGSPTGDILTDGGNLLLRLSTEAADARQEHYQLYYDRNRRQVGDGFAEERGTLDASFLQNRAWGRIHDLVWGGGYRRSADRIRNSETLVFSPDRRTVEVYNLYAQNDAQVTADLTLTVGTKLEHNDFTGFEWQPTARFLWSHSPGTKLWGAVSRAVRMPNRLEHDARIVGGDSADDATDDFLGELPIDEPDEPTVESCIARGGDPALCELFFDPAASNDLVGNRDFESETVLAYELGLRHRLARRFSVDGALFFNDYRNLRGVDRSGGEARFGNEMEGRGYGGELIGLWDPAPSLRLRLGYSYLDLELESRAGGSDQSESNPQGNDPRHQVFLHCDWRVAEHLDARARARHVGARPNQSVPAYNDLDLGLAWQPLEGAELAVFGRNLLHPAHQEFGGSAAGLIERSVFVTLRLGQ